MKYCSISSSNLAISALLTCIDLVVVPDKRFSSVVQFRSIICDSFVD